MSQEWQLSDEVREWEQRDKHFGAGPCWGYLVCETELSSYTKMGNCLNTPTADDISLLRGGDSQDGSDASTLGPPPPYQVNRIFAENHPHRWFLILFFQSVFIPCDRGSFHDRWLCNDQILLNCRSSKSSVVLNNHILVGVVLIFFPIEEATCSFVGFLFIYFSYSSHSRVMCHPLLKECSE